LRKRSKSREAGLNRVSAVDIGLDEQATSESQKTKLEFEHRLSLGGKGQLNDQRGLLNKEDLELPDFLKGESSKSGNFDQGTIPSCEEADAFFGHVGDDPFDTDLKGDLGGSMHSIAFSETSSCNSLFPDSINKENQSTPVRIPSERKRLQAMSTSSETDHEFLNPRAPLRVTNSQSELRKRQSLTQADLIDLPSPPKTKRISPPKATVV